MLQFRQLVVAAVCLMGCMSDVDEQEPIGLAQSGLGDNDVNEFRNRKTAPKPFNTRKSDCASDPRVTLGLVSADICVGADLFFREPFGGNGRACGTALSEVTAADSGLGTGMDYQVGPGTLMF